jgi:uncharacterized protein (DUF1800 family)
MNLFKLLAARTGVLDELDKIGALPSRRALLFGSSVLGTLWASKGRADPPPPVLNWMVQRLTMGFTGEELALAQAAGTAQDYLEYHLAYTAIDDSILDQRLQSYPTLFMQPYELIPVSPAHIISELTEATILRSVLSKRQLFERMVEFWTDHFNIDINNGNARWLKTIDDRDVIRAHALDTFPALLSASAHSPAMLYYLDNASSVAGNPNENYARELMELHTLSVNGGYTQQDVIEVARCFTGWTVYPTNWPVETLRWTFRYNGAVHDNGAKVVLGHDIPAGGGINDGLMVLDILANHPSTAQFISKKLCKRFWSYDPPQSLIDDVAATYTATGGDIKEMLRTLFANPDPATVPPKYKRPYHLLVSGLRGAAADIVTTTGLRTQLAAAGQIPFSWGPPDGYPDTLSAWVGLILPRWNFGAALMNNNVSGTSVDINAFLAGVPNTAQGVADQIDTALFGGQMPPADKDRIRDYMLPDPPTTARKREALGLAIGSPGYQWY